MKEQFRDSLHLGKKNQIMLKIINDIIQEYLDEGYKLTLRQLYYQLVSRDIIPNRVQEYAKLSTLLVKGRMAGVVDWSAIEDRIRIPYLPYWVSGINDAINDTIDQYRLNRQEGQDCYIEIWVEKDALSGVLKRITEYYHINLMVNRGYSSCSAMYNAHKRFIRYDKKCYIIYLGDHDPSGLDMIRDINDRLKEFGSIVEIKHIALTGKQIKKHNPPPNPAKITDPRANWYINNFSNVSWEVDALKPQILDRILRNNIETIIDINLFEKQISQEQKDKFKLKKFLTK